MKNNQFKKQGLLTTLVFLSIIGCGTIVSAVKPDQEFSAAENRTLAQRPELTSKTLFSGDFMDDYETYFSDQFFLRDEWISIKTTAERLMQKKDSNGVYFGKDDYLLAKQEKDDYTGKTAEKNLETLKKFVNNQVEALGKEHVRVLLAPTATRILKEKLPAYAPNYDQKLYLDKVKAALFDECFVDVFPKLWEHRYNATNDEIYYHNDHHWTSLGAYLAYQTYMDSINEPAFERTDFEKETCTTSFLGTLQAKVNTYGVMDSIELYKKKNATFCIIRNEDPKDTMDGLFDYEALDTKDKYEIFLGGNEPFMEIDCLSGQYTDEAATFSNATSDDFASSGNTGNDSASLQDTSDVLASSGNTGNDSASLHDTSDVSKEKRLLIVKDSYANCFVPFVAGNYDKVYLVDLRYYNKALSSTIKEKEITDILVLYNVSTFVTDTGVGKMGI